MKASLRDLLLVGGGGLCGAIARYWTGLLVYRLAPNAALPWATLLVNVVGCFAIGLLVGLAQLRGSPGREAHLLLGVGFLGALTTFSTFGLETVQLASGRGVLRAGANVVLHLVLGLAAVVLGGALARLFSQRAWS